MGRPMNPSEKSGVAVLKVQEVSRAQELLMAGKSLDSRMLVSVTMLETISSRLLTLVVDSLK